MPRAVMTRRVQLAVHMDQEESRWKPEKKRGSWSKT